MDNTQDSPQRSTPPKDWYDGNELVAPHFAFTPALTSAKRVYRKYGSPWQASGWAEVADAVKTAVIELYTRYGLTFCDYHGLYIAGSDQEIRQEDRDRMMILVFEMRRDEIHLWHAVYEDLNKILEDNELVETAGVCIRFYKQWNGPPHRQAVQFEVQPPSRTRRSRDQQTSSGRASGAANTSRISDQVMPQPMRTEAGSSPPSSRFNQFGDEPLRTPIDTASFWEQANLSEQQSRSHHTRDQQRARAHASDAANSRTVSSENPMGPRTTTEASDLANLQFGQLNLEPPRTPVDVGSLWNQAINLSRQPLPAYDFSTQQHLPEPTRWIHTPAVQPLTGIYPTNRWQPSDLGPYTLDEQEATQGMTDLFVYPGGRLARRPQQPPQQQRPLLPRPGRPEPAFEFR